MCGVLGSIKNRLRQWRINYLRNKKKKQREIEEGKLAKYYTLKRIAYSGLTLIYYPFTLFHTPSINVYPELSNIEEEIKKVGHGSFKQTEKQMNKIEKQLQKVEQKITKTLSNQEPTVQKEVTNTIQQLKEQIAVMKKPIKTKEVSVLRQNLKSSIAPQLDASQKSESLVKEPQQVIDNKQDDQKKIKQIEEDIRKLSVKVMTSKEYALFYEYEQRLNECKKQLEAMKDDLEKRTLLLLISKTVKF